MMEPPRSDIRIISWISLILYAWCVWSYVKTTSDNDDDLRFFWYTAKYCQKIASWFGRVGIQAENRYNELYESKGYR